MYAYFTENETFNFVAESGIVDYVDRISGLGDRAKRIYQILLSELKRLFFNKKIKEDDKGIYVELARSVIGEKMGLCSHTIAKYIKELQRYGLLMDRRMGVNLCNRIYLKYRTDAKRYEKDKSNKAENGQKNNDVKPASNTSSQNNTLINKSKEIISQLTDECLPDRTINQMLILCNDNLDILKASVENCFGRTPIKGYIPMLFDTLRNKYYEKKEKRKQDRNSNTTKSGRKKPNSHFVVTESHGFDVDVLEKIEMLHQQLRLGYITQEEFDEQKEKLNMYK